MDASALCSPSAAELLHCLSLQLTIKGAWAAPTCAVMSHVHWKYRMLLRSGRSHLLGRTSAVFADLADFSEGWGSAPGRSLRHQQPQQQSQHRAQRLCRQEQRRCFWLSTSHAPRCGHRAATATGAAGLQQASESAHATSWHRPCQQLQSAHVTLEGGVKWP